MRKKWSMLVKRFKKEISFQRKKSSGKNVKKIVKLNNFHQFYDDLLFLRDFIGEKYGVEYCERSKRRNEKKMELEMVVDRLSMNSEKTPEPFDDVQNIAENDSDTDSSDLPVILCEFSGYKQQTQPSREFNCDSKMKVNCTSSSNETDLQKKWKNNYPNQMNDDKFFLLSIVSFLKQMKFIEKLDTKIDILTILQKHSSH